MERVHRKERGILRPIKEGEVSKRGARLWLGVRPFSFPLRAAYTLVKVKFPEPLQAVDPDKLHVPVMVLLEPTPP